jgi:hypothetical protein
MRTSVRFTAVMALAAACAPSFAAGSGAGTSSQWPVARSQQSQRPPSSLSLTLPELATGYWLPATASPGHTLLLRPCSLVAFDAPEPAPLPPPPPVYPSLGGPSRSLRPLDDLPRLRDETRQEDPDDALRLIRSRW